VRRWPWIQTASLAATSFAALSFLGMLGLFVVESLPVWGHSGFGYLSGIEWFYRVQRFGALPMIYGTLVVSAIALVLAAPLGLGAAVFIAEILPPRLRIPAKTAIELLAGIPSVVYGLLGVILLRGFMQRALAPFDPLSGDTLATAGVLLAVMILPTIVTLSEDALRSVPASQRQAARALGLLRGETILRVSLPQARAGIIAALLLALGRALGETIAVFLVVGRQDNQWPDRLFSLEPLAAAGQTLTSKLGGSETHIAYGDPLHWAAMLGLALVLLVLVATVTLAGSMLTGNRQVGSAKNLARASLPEARRHA
jgi:phosphate transport system permease protein